jgi:hypothetical protein
MTLSKGLSFKKLSSKNTQHDPSDDAMRMRCTNYGSGCRACNQGLTNCLSQCQSWYNNFCDGKREEWRTECNNSGPPDPQDPKPPCFQNCEQIKTSFVNRNNDISPKCIRVYNDKNYKGEVKDYCSGVDSVSRSGFCNDCISSLKLGAHVVKVILYQNAKYGGKSVEITQDNERLSNISFNDSTSSFKIIARDIESEYQNCRSNCDALTWVRTFESCSNNCVNNRHRHCREVTFFGRSECQYCKRRYQC